MIWLKHYLEEYFHEPVEVTIPNGRFGDYTTNILLKKKIQPDALVDYLLSHKLISDVKVVNGHINIFLTTELIERSGELSETPYRAYVVHNRLFIEGYLTGTIEAYWMPLLKKVNELNYCLDVFNQSFDLEKMILDLFRKLDHTYVYRNNDKEELGGISHLLGQMLVALGRLS